MAENNFIMVRASEAEKLLIDEACAKTFLLTGQKFNRSELIRIALNDYYLKLEEMENEKGK